MGLRLSLYEDDWEDAVFDCNITSNLQPMARECGVYLEMWEPKSLYAKQAKDVVDMLKIGLQRLKRNPRYYKSLEPKNGWGTYNGFVNVLSKYIIACEIYPKSRIFTSV